MRSPETRFFGWIFIIFATICAKVNITYIRNFESIADIDKYQSINVTKFNIILSLIFAVSGALMIGKNKRQHLIK